MEGARLLGVDDVPFVQVVVESQLSQHLSECGDYTTRSTDLVAEEAAANVDLLTSNNHDLLTSKNLLGNNGSQTSQEVALAVNDDRSCGERSHFGLQQRKRPFSKPEKTHN